MAFYAKLRIAEITKTTEDIRRGQIVVSDYTTDLIGTTIAVSEGIVGKLDLEVLPL